MSNCPIPLHCIVITGSTKGIGLGLAQAFLKLGCAVVICGRNQTQLNETLIKLSMHFNPNHILGLICDVSDPAQVNRLWNSAIFHFGKVDIWINNAGTCPATQAFIDISDAELIQVVQTNILGVMMCCRTVLYLMQQQGQGQIYNMEGWGSHGEWTAGMTAYSTSKYAISYFSKALYKENKHKNVLIGTLNPGMVATDLLIASWQNGDHKNWHKMKKLFYFVIDPPEIVCTYLAKRIYMNRKRYVRIAWMTPLRLLLRFFQPYYWKRNPVKGTALEHLE